MDIDSIELWELALSSEEGLEVAGDCLLEAGIGLDETLHGGIRFGDRYCGFLLHIENGYDHFWDVAEDLDDGARLQGASDALYRLPTEYQTFEPKFFDISYIYQPYTMDALQVTDEAVYSAAFREYAMSSAAASSQARGIIRPDKI